MLAEPTGRLALGTALVLACARRAPVEAAAVVCPAPMPDWPVYSCSERTSGGTVAMVVVADGHSMQLMDRGRGVYEDGVLQARDAAATWDGCRMISQYGFTNPRQDVCWPTLHEAIADLHAANPDRPLAGFQPTDAPPRWAYGPRRTGAGATRPSGDRAKQHEGPAGHPTIPKEEP
jgi:hypothetical protein